MNNLNEVIVNSVGEIKEMNREYLINNRENPKYERIQVFFDPLLATKTKSLEFQMIRRLIYE